MDDITPASWLCAAIDLLKHKNPNFSFKVLTESLQRDVVKVLNQNDGSVWTFTCAVERGPA